MVVIFYYGRRLNTHSASVSQAQIALSTGLPIVLHHLLIKSQRRFAAVRYKLDYQLR